MLINLVEPSKIHEEMRIAGEFIVALIEYCYDQNITDGQFNEKSFLRSKKHKRFKDCCLLQHPGAMRNRLRELFTDMTDAMMAELVRILKEDLNYIRGHKIAGFRFAGFLEEVYKGLDRTLRGKIVKQIATVFEKLYDDFFGYIQVGSELNNRDRFKEEYRRVNGHRQHVCPACLGQLQLNKAQLDHYFPKSLFPALSVQPFNLVPICSECNTSIGKKRHKGKGNRVPTWPSPDDAVNQPDCLDGTYLPFIRSAERKFKAVVAGSPGSRFVLVHPLSTAAPNEKERLRRHVATFNLENVWTDRVPFHFNMLMQRTLSEFAQLHRERKQNQKKIDREEVGDFLWNKLILNTDDALYEIGYQFEFVSYVISITTTPESFYAFYRELLKRLDTRKQKALSPIPHIFDGYTEPY